jgi:hypothetical protein
MFISGGPSSQTHFPYQADLCGNISPPDPLLSLPARRVNRPATALRQPPPSSGASRSMSPTRPLPPPFYSPGQGRVVLTPSFFSPPLKSLLRLPPHCFSPPRRLPSRGAAAPPSHCQALRLTPLLFCRPMPELELTSATSASSIEPCRQHHPSCLRSHHRRPLIAVASKLLPVCATSFFHVELRSMHCSPSSHPQAERPRCSEPTHRKPVAFSPTRSSHQAPRPRHPRSLSELPRPPPIDARAQRTTPPQQRCCCYSPNDMPLPIFLVCSPAGIWPIRLWPT